MKRVITEDDEVRGMAERLGAWPAIEASIAQGRSGSLVAGPWISATPQMGLVALETSDPLEAALLVAAIAAHLGGLQSLGFATPEPPVTH